MIRTKRLLAVALLAALPVTVAISAEPVARPAYPTPNLYPLAWELKFEHGKPQRFVVDVPGQSTPQAFWYMTYMVTNATDREQQWLPVFEMLDDQGNLHQANGKNIPGAVFDAIKKREGNKLLESPARVSGPIRVGDGEARESVAIWAEPNPRMGRFSIFITGLSGEVRQFRKTAEGLAELKTGADFKNTPDGERITLRKTLQLNYHINGDEVYPGEDEVNERPELWVMR